MTIYKTEVIPKWFKNEVFTARLIYVCRVIKFGTERILIPSDINPRSSMEDD